MFLDFFPFGLFPQACCSPLQSSLAPVLGEDDRVQESEDTRAGPLIAGSDCEDGHCCYVSEPEEKPTTEFQQIELYYILKYTGRCSFTGAWYYLLLHNKSSIHIKRC